MNHVLLATLVAFQGSGGHAEVHPKDASLYLEVPDIPALVAAYADAPLLRILEEDSVRTALEGLEFAAETDPRAAVRELFRVFMPEPAVEELFDALQRFSFSLTVIGEGEPASVSLLVLADFAEPVHATRARELVLEDAQVKEASPDAPLDARIFTSELLPDQEFWCAAKGARFLIASETPVADFVQRTQSSADSLGNTPTFEAARKHFGEPEGTTLFWLSQSGSPFEILRDADEAADLLDGDLADTPYQEIPPELDPFGGRRVLRMELIGKRFVTEMFAPSASGGALGNQPIETSWLEPLPEGAMLVYATSFDGEALGRKLESVLAAVRGEMGEEDAPSIPFESVLSQLGPGLSIGMKPINTIGFPETIGLIQVKSSEGSDAKSAIRERLDALVQALGNELPGFASRTREYKVKDATTGERVAIPITTITLPQEWLVLGPMLSVSPAYAILEDRILVASSSMSIKRELKRTHGEEKQERGNPIAVNGFEVPDDARSVVMMDWGMQLEAAMNVAKMFAGLAGDAAPFDPDALPSPEVLTRDLRPTVHYSRRVEGGTYRYHEASFGPETWAWLLGAFFSDDGPTAAPQPLETGLEVDGEDDGE